MYRLAALTTRKTGLDELLPSWRLIEDVLAGRLKRRASMTPTGGLAPAASFHTPQSVWSSPYLPKGRLEPETEYSLRVELTPFFPETPRVLASRLGALLKNHPRIDGVESPALRDFLQQSGRQHARFEDLLAQAAHLAQVYGFCVALLDRNPLPPDVENVSAAEADVRKLGRPYLALYGAPEVLDWQHGPDGELAWVKFGERGVQRKSWDDPGVEQLTYRIVDRTSTRVYRVRRAPSPLEGEGESRSIGTGVRGAAEENSSSFIEDDWVITAEPPQPHGFSRVPVVFCHPFPGLDGIGRPLLARCAEADLAATRILSDLVWDLYILGNPILTFKTSRGENELERLGVGATRYIPLRNGTKDGPPPEELAFVQLDPTGLEMLFKAHEVFSSQAARQAGLSGGDASAVPVQQSGVARAWAFKTGEERLLFLLARALEPFLTEGLRLAAEALQVADRPSVQLPENFDVSGPEQAVALAGDIAKLSKETGAAGLRELAVERAAAALGES